MDFFSHLGICLKSHLQYVGNKSLEIIKSKKIVELDNNIISEAAYLIGISHDFGKYTTFFQKKLKNSIIVNKSLTYHSLISSIFAFELMNDYIKQKKYENIYPYKFLPLIAYFIVKHHHGNLDDIKNDLNHIQLFEYGFKNIQKQLQDIKQNNNQIKSEYVELLKDFSNINIDCIFSKMEKYEREINYSKDIKQLIDDISRLGYCLQKKQCIIHYLLTILLYSVLIDSDKKHAADIREIKRKEIPENLVESYISSDVFKKKNKSKIDEIREQIRKSVLKNINTKDKIFTLTAPTGTGKTLTSLSAALKLRKKLKKELKLDYEPRIIYSLPFTSVIDQNYDVFDEVLCLIKDFKEKESEYLLKHHHLSEISYKTENIEKEMEVDESLALIESWESEIIVTTFIQLFYTLIGYKNRSLKKFHNIVNSIILLDEVQNIPIKYWGLVEEILNNMSKYFHCHIILLTATKPLIFKEGTYKELVENYAEYFRNEALNRVCLKINNSETTVSDFCNNLKTWTNQSYLFVFNTIGSSLEFYKLITKKVENFKICYLSTNIIPKIRKQRIEKIKETLKNNERLIVVSTQLIEAGVDIDCACVYRDIGPLDSIIQVAGRCNRNKSLDCSNVYLIKLVDNKELFANYVYSPVLLDVVSEILKNNNDISEKDFLDLINAYFKEVKNKINIDEAKKLLVSIYGLCFNGKNSDKRKPISEFELITEVPYKVDVFVELDECAKKVWNKYDEIIKNKKLRGFEKKMEFLKIKKEFYNYIISIPKHSQNLPQEINGLYYVSNSLVDDYYDKETGFKKNSETQIW
jgi:CRISPR-associated endonuclease/helicase Cas3